MLKEQVRLGATEICSLDWETYPVLRFTEASEIDVALIDPIADRPALGVGEATAGPTSAAIGKAVAHALGARLHKLPLTCERVAALRRAAHFAETWQPTPLSLADLIACQTALRQACQQIGRVTPPKTRMSFRVKFSTVTGNAPPAGAELPPG